MDTLDCDMEGATSCHEYIQRLLDTRKAKLLAESDTNADLQTSDFVEGKLLEPCTLCQQGDVVARSTEMRSFSRPEEVSYDCDEWHCETSLERVGAAFAEVALTGNDFADYAADQDKEDIHFHNNFKHNESSHVNESSRGVEVKDTEKGSLKLVKYARDELLALQEHALDSMNEWERVIADLGPVADELFSLELTKDNLKRPKRRQRTSCGRKNPAGKYHSGLENLVVPSSRGLEELYSGNNDYEAVNENQCVAEHDFYEDSDYEESLQPLAFSVEGEPDFDSGPPEDGFEYLRRVMWEAAQCPKVKIAKIDPKKLSAKQTPYMPEIASIPACSSDLLPTMEWRREFIADFSQLRMRLSNASLSKDTMIKDLPACSNVPGWKHFCFGRADNCKMEEELQDKCVGERSSSLEDLQIGNPELLSNTYSICETFRDIKSGCSPLLSIVLSLDEVSRATLLRYHVSWLEEVDIVMHDRALWLFALSAVVDKPLDDLTSASFRALLRKCASLRAAKKLRDEDLDMLNILIAIAGSYFGQADESMI